MKNSPLALGCAALVLASGFVAGAGCGSAPEPRDLMSEEVRSEQGDRPVAMKGEDNFLDGNVHLTATIARGFDRTPGRKTGAGPKVRKGFFNHDTDAYKEDYSFDYGDSEEQQKEAIKEYIRQAMARRAAGSPMPPVTLHVTFENKGASPIEIEPTEVNSDLGNFAARPKKLTIAPGEKASLDPMVSQLGVTSDEIPLTVSVRAGGKSETKVVLVKNIIAASLRTTTIGK
jgi:hypothetical protein